MPVNSNTTIPAIYFEAGHSTSNEEGPNHGVAVLTAESVDDAL